MVELMYKIDNKKEFKELINEFKEHYEDYQEYYETFEPLKTTFNNFIFNVWRNGENFRYTCFNCVCNEKIPVFKILEHLESNKHNKSKLELINLKPF